ncbi:hypothetical protein C0991_010168 [Blastosporella zonata]|nr:hypothetical protein C0991_010168 [Blastosporella zonata]
MRLPKLRPRLHVFGHIHEARGGHIHAWGEGEGVMPEVNIDEDSDDSDSDLDEEYDARAQHKEEQVLLPNVTQPLISKEETDETMAAPQAETVFVNASTFPMGRGEWRAGERVPFGGPGFQPVIVDLRDSLATSLT